MPSIINSDDGVVSGTSGLKTTGGNDGLLNIQTNGSTAMSINASQQVTFNNGANLPNTFGMKNRIINGGMVIDQRNAGASVTVDGAALYTVDRWQAHDITDGAYTAQQSSTAPTGFVKSLLLTVTSADASLGASQYAFLTQPIEGFNVADLGWGTANAQSITISFWVRSSLTGTFGGALRNGSGSRSYPFTYTISSANTFEYKTVTIAGDTTGTWETTNLAGILLSFGLGVGSTFSGTAGAWAAGNFVSATGATSVIGTNGATFYITGVQLERGSTATSFDFRPYGTELMLCQRYFEVLPIVNGDIDMNFNGFVIAAALADMGMKFAVTKRAAPTMTLNNVTQFRNGASNITPASGFSFTYTTTYGAIIRANHTATLSGGTGAALIGGTNASIFASIEL